MVEPSSKEESAKAAKVVSQSTKPSNHPKLKARLCPVIRVHLTNAEAVHNATFGNIHKLLTTQVSESSVLEENDDKGKRQFPVGYKCLIFVFKVAAFLNLPWNNF